MTEETLDQVLPAEVVLSIGDGGVASIELRPRRGASIPLRLATLLQLHPLLDEIEQGAAAGAVSAVLLQTAPPHPNLPGYDLEEIRQLREDRIRDWSREGQRVLRRLELLPVPSVAAIRQEWLGGAAELALACAHRVAVDKRVAGIGFPQTRLGLLPAWGGTVRLPRLVGLRSALDLVLGGETLRTDQAAEVGLLDEVFGADGFEERITGFALGLAERSRRRSRSRKPLRARLLDETAPGRRLVTARASRIFARGGGANLAGKLALDLIRETLDLPLEAAFNREAEAASELIVGREAQGRLHSERLTERAARRTPLGPAEFQAAAVVGSGQTGADLAHLLLASGTSVRIKGSDRAAVRRTVGQVHERVAWERAKGRISDQQARRRVGRVEGVTGYGGFGTLDLLLLSEHGGDGEGQTLAELEAHVLPGCLIAVHDWPVSPSVLQRSMQHPERLLGLSAALPAERFPLLEIVPGTLTAPDHLGAARRLARRLALTGVVVSDSTPPPGVRLLGAYLAEAARLWAEGAGVEEIDGACTSFGFELGPFQRMDAIGTARARQLVAAASAASPATFALPELFERVAASGNPFYEYKSGKSVGINPELTSLSQPNASPTVREAFARLRLLLINEAARIMESGGVADPGDLEVIAIYGLGFPKERGGLLFHAGELGLGTVVDDLIEHAGRLGDRFAPTGLLRDLATSGRGFFGTGGVLSSGQPIAPVLE